MLLVVWLLGYAGLIYGTGAFAAVYMVDHGASAHFVFLLFAVAGGVRFAAFQVNSLLGERFERRDVMCGMAGLFILSWIVIYLIPALPVIAVFLPIAGIGADCGCLTSTTTPRSPIRPAYAPAPLPGLTGSAISEPGPASPCSVRSMSWAESSRLDPVDTDPGALLPAVLIRSFGIKQAGVVLEQVSA